MTELLSAIVGVIVGVPVGLYLYHYALGQAGWLGRIAARKAEKKLKKIGLTIVAGGEKQEVTGDEPGHRSNLRYGEFRRKE